MQEASSAVESIAKRLPRKERKRVFKIESSVKTPQMHWLREVDSVLARN